MAMTMVLLRMKGITQLTHEHLNNVKEPTNKDMILRKFRILRMCDRPSTPRVQNETVYGRHDFSEIGCSRPMGAKADTAL